MKKYLAIFGVLGLAACSTATYDPLANNSDSATDGVIVETFDNGAVLKTFPDGSKEFTVPPGEGLFF